MSEFTTLAGFKKAWAAVRGDVLEANGMSRDASNVRLRAGTIVMDVWLADRWIPYTDNGPDMRERVRYGGTFRLRTVTTPL